MTPARGREAALDLDAQNPLADRRALFDLPDGVIYLDGNSLGALPRSVTAHLGEVVTKQWGQGLISSWNDADWIRLPGRVAEKIGRLVGTSGSDIHVGDSTSVLLFKVGDAFALRLFTPFMMDVGFSKTEIALVLKALFTASAVAGAVSAARHDLAHAVRIVAVGERAPGDECQ